MELVQTPLLACERTNQSRYTPWRNFVGFLIANPTISWNLLTKNNPIAPKKAPFAYANGASVILCMR